MLGQCACQPSTKVRQGRTTLVPQETSCFHQFLSRCSTRSLETCTSNSIAKMYCSIMSPTSHKFQINQKRTHAISTAHISNRMVTFTSTLITQQPARHCSASPIANRTLKCQHQNITSIQKFTKQQPGLGYSLYFCLSWVHFLSKALCEKSINSIQIFFSFLIFPVTQLPVTFSYIHITFLLSVWVPMPNFCFWPLFLVVEIPPPPQEMVEVPPPPQGMI